MSCRVTALFEAFFLEMPPHCTFLARVTHVCVRSFRRNVTTAGRVYFPLFCVDIMDGSQHRHLKHPQQQVRFVCLNCCISSPAWCITPFPFSSNAPPHCKKVGDVWQLCGGNPNLRFTWDMAENDNLVFGGGFKPRARYDRYLLVAGSIESGSKLFHAWEKTIDFPPGGS